MDKLSINKIKKLNMSFYNCSLDKIIDHIFSRMDFVKSIIVYGNINHPGISDLDLILVLNDGTYFKDFQLIKLYRYLRNNFSEIIFHYPLFIHEKFVPELNYLFPIFSYSIIERDGTKRKINLTSTNTQKKFHLLQVFLTKFPKSFKLYNEIDNSNFREFLLEINSLKHTFRIFQELNPKELFNEINFFNNKIDTIRQDQVNGILHEKSDIIKFFKETKNLFFDMVKKLNGGAIDQHSSKEENMYITLSLAIESAVVSISQKYQTGL